MVLQGFSPSYSWHGQISITFSGGLFRTLISSYFKTMYELVTIKCPLGPIG